jgi:type I restriction enzyme M protein
MAKSGQAVRLMAKKLTDTERQWYYDALSALGTGAVTPNQTAHTVTYNSAISSDESHVKSADAEELAHAVMVALLHSPSFKYPLSAIGHEIHFAHGSKGSKSDEVDILIRDADGLPYAVVELKAANEFDRDRNDAIKNQLFGTAPLVGSPKLLVYATVEPRGPGPKIRAICIDYTKHKSFEAWIEAGEPHSITFPSDYHDIDYEPFVSQGKNDLDLDSTQADFRAIALTFHNEFFGEHPDNTLFVNLVKCLLAKIHDERTRKKGESYEFQIFYKNGKPDAAVEVFARVNELYKAAYKRYVDPAASEIDEINPKEFSEERVKSVVQSLQGISITKGAARHGDIIGAFFEEILRSGFKQDRGMYFTHDNVVRFMVEAVDLAGLTRQVWQKSNHPDNRLPYAIDPACGSGTFLLHAMSTITSTVRSAEKTLVTDHDSEQFYKARLSDDQPNYWAENFVYGFDPKFIMAITAKVNMVLHGDGSAHIFKEDAFKPFARYTDVRLRPCSEAQRSVTRAQYGPDLCESFDVVISNPPFGITLSSETRAKLGTTFTLPEAAPSEGLFVERCFQLLKPNGRLAIVAPESLLNAKEIIAVRLFLYRFFKLRAIVSMPRNIFIDTPTLTSLIFAQKKTAEEIAEWDDAWAAATATVEARIKTASKALQKSYAATHSGAEVADVFLKGLSPVVGNGDWILKGGKTPAVVKFSNDWPSDATGETAASHYREAMNTSGFKALCQSYVFSKVSEKLSHEFPVFMVSEVGYKLSKRKERARPNQLCALRGRRTKTLVTNMHLAGEECDTIVDTAAPKVVLDAIRAKVKWSE